MILVLFAVPAAMAFAAGWAAARTFPKPIRTFDDLRALLPHAHIEEVSFPCDDDDTGEELVIYSGWKTDRSDRLVPYDER